MSRQPDLVLLTGDLTHNGSDAEWAEYKDRLGALAAPSESLAGNHDHNITELRGHRSRTAGPLHLVLVDSSEDKFTNDDAAWLDAELSAHADQITAIAIHHPPFETGIWWMDCVGLQGKEKFKEVVRRHPQVIKILSGHVHRPIQTSWGGCSLWVCPSTSVTVAGDLDPDHVPAETAEGPSFSLHGCTGSGANIGIVSHVVPVGAAAARTAIEEAAPDFVKWVRGVQANRAGLFD